MLPVTKTTLFTRAFTACLSPDNTARMRTHVRTYTHAYSEHPHEFSIIQIGFPNWVRTGGSRWFSLSIGRGFPVKLFPLASIFESYEFAILPPPRPPNHGKRSTYQTHMLPFLSFVFTNFPIWYRPRTRENADRDSASKRSRNYELEIKEEWSVVCFNALLAISTGNSARIEVDPTE